jgi:hypothetical protein
MASARSHDLSARLDPRDREFVATLDPSEREIVTSTILRYQTADRLEVGDAVPALSLHRLDANGRVPLTELGRDRPLVLVFGSFT